jgi:hypothetical protein
VCARRVGRSVLGLGDRRQAARVGHDHLLDVGPDDAGDLQRVARGLHRDAILPTELLSELAQRVGPCRDPRAAAHAPVCLADRDLAEVAMHVQADAASLHRLLPSRL